MSDDKSNTVSKAEVAGLRLAASSDPTLKDRLRLGGDDTAPAGMIRQGGLALVLDAKCKEVKSGIGVYTMGIDKKSGAETGWQWVCSRLEVEASTRSYGSQEWGRLVTVHDADGVVHRWAMPSSMLAGEGVAYRERLLSLGLAIAPGDLGRNGLHAYLSRWKPARRARCVERPGWHGGAFVLPDQTFGAPEGEDVILQTAGEPPEYATAGTLESWQEELAAFCAGTDRLMLAIGAAFAGPLLLPLQEESGGFHFGGASSTGKSTALKVGASVWGLRPGSWRTTDNAAEAAAIGACDALATLDEIGEADGRVVHALAYMLSNGTGKARMKRDASARALPTWRLLFLSSGEKGLAEKMAEAGQRRQAGQEARVVEIPADAGKGLGLFEKLHEEPDADALSRRLRQAAEANKGHAGRAFLEWFTGDTEAAIAKARAVRRQWLDQALAAVAPDGAAPGQVSRVAGRFALVAAAGTLAEGWCLVPWHEGATAEACQRLFKAWLAARGGLLPAEIRDGLAQVRAFIEAHGSGRFEDAWRTRAARTEPTENDKGEKDAPLTYKVQNRVGFRRLETVAPATDRWTYYILPEAWRGEVCRGFDHAAIARHMVRAKWLVRGEGKNLARYETVPGLGRARFYHVTADFLAADPAWLALDQGEGEP